MADNYPFKDNDATVRTMAAKDVGGGVLSPRIQATMSSYAVDAATSSRIASAATTNATSVKATAGALISISVYNSAASATRHLKIYNKASAPTVGTDTPIATIPIAAGSGREITFPWGLYCSSGIAYAITGAIADSDTTAVAANDVHGVITYK